MKQQQEQALLAAFRAVDPEDKLIILGYVEHMAEKRQSEHRQKAKKPVFRLVSGGNAQ
ncbi:hypothetical protein [Noviherbaspirillum sp.]|jgi:hypothetical protein|uniref:hypothetical protein n=1 Tax=Noviherbaspirillum sp. TaxID=1926288 RepID=UPI0025E1482C|nr:hypothetical protein [Noviherbaspirillum sp.]